jgi:phosphatidylglycerophosphate synthase
VSLALGLCSAAAYAGGSTLWLVAGSALLLCSLVVDCVDGEVARYTRTFSPLGGWLDVASDRIKEYAVYAGLVVGVERTGGEGPWLLALAAMAVLVVRHFVDFGFAASAVARPGSSAVAALSEATSHRGAVLWAKRAVIMPVGERTILLVAASPLVGARVTLLALLLLGVLAGAYTTAGRVGRAWGARPEEAHSAGSERLVAQCDALPIPAAALGVNGRFGWLAPAAARVLELALVVALSVWAAQAGLLAGAYAVLAASALRCYDIVYRQRLTGSLGPSDSLRWCGWPVRAIAVGVLAGAVSSGQTSAETGTGILVGAAIVWLMWAGSANARWWYNTARALGEPG